MRRNEVKRRHLEQAQKKTGIKQALKVKDRNRRGIVYAFSVRCHQSSLTTSEKFGWCLL